jgi:hypothetical protein
MSYRACDANGNCKIIDDKKPKGAKEGADTLMEQNASTQYGDQSNGIKQMMDST